VAPAGRGPSDEPDGPSVTVDVLATEDNPEAIPVELPPVSGTHHYMPALDGLRALAVLGVVAYHFGLHWADGGYLGVDFFFVLSGFLITGLLVGEWDSRQTIGLRPFWFRRAKRLLPAVMVLLVVLSVYSRLGGPNIVFVVGYAVDENRLTLKSGRSEVAIKDFNLPFNCIEAIWQEHEHRRGGWMIAIRGCAYVTSEGVSYLP